ncbi:MULTISPECIES: hypothetical protein [Photobacterium]|uniref:hypothetical protein n=1 Tax=Photobacterium TaxID=657 RepID=UPI0014743C87|nr:MULTISPECIES: hypothetical protein [Photobacterium]MDX1301274.1 hypothetical protein [Photobacterium sp.]
MAKWEQWLGNGSQSKEKFKTKNHDDFFDVSTSGKNKKRRKSHKQRSDYNEMDDYIMM